MTIQPGESGKVLAIVGSRDFVVPYAALYARRIIEFFIAKVDPKLVISGGAEGIDSIGIDVADKMGYPWFEYRPEGHSWEHFKARNLLIAQACDTMVVIRCHAATTYGSGWTGDRAKEMGKDVYPFTL